MYNKHENFLLGLGFDLLQNDFTSEHWCLGKTLIEINIVGGTTYIHQRRGEHNGKIFTDIKYTGQYFFDNLSFSIMLFNKLNILDLKMKSFKKWKQSEIEMTNCCKKVKIKKEKNFNY